jgi:universal stress protein E
LERILVATDLGPDADEAIRQAHAWAQIYAAELIACAVLPMPHVSPREPHERDLSWQAQTKVRERLAELTGRAPGSMVVAVKRGAPFAEICRTAREHDVDLVVIGSSQKRGVRHMVVGGTAEKVVRCAHSRVLIARRSPASASVLAATDLSDPTYPVIAAAADYAERRRGALSVLHCLEPESSPLPPVGDMLSNFVPSRSGLRLKGEATLGRAMAGLGITATRVVEDAPARTAILREADARACEMIVIGTSGRRGLVRLALGNLAESILRAAPCSTLVVRLGERRPNAYS